MNLSNHAESRCQQRGIRSRQVDLLIKYGTMKEKDGAYECFIPKNELDWIRSQLKQELQDLDKISKSNKTLILNENKIITAYNKYSDYHHSSAIVTVTHVLGIRGTPNRIPTIKCTG